MFSSFGHKISFDQFVVCLIKTAPTVYPCSSAEISMTSLLSHLRLFESKPEHKDFTLKDFMEEFISLNLSKDLSMKEINKMF